MRSRSIAAGALAGCLRTFAASMRQAAAATRSDLIRQTEPFASSLMRSSANPRLRSPVSAARLVCGSQSVTSIISSRVAPFGRAALVRAAGVFAASFFPAAFDPLFLSFEPSWVADDEGACWPSSSSDSDRLAPRFGDLQSEPAVVILVPDRRIGLLRDLGR